MSRRPSRTNPFQRVEAVRRQQEGLRTFGPAYATPAGLGDPLARYRPRPHPPRSRKTRRS